MNIEMLNRVKQTILDEPRKLDMNVFLKRYPDEMLGRAEDFTPCGTHACIAGWACILDIMDKRGITVEEISRDTIRNKDDYENEYGKAGKILAINRVEQYKLFYLEDWPSEFTKRYDDSKTAQERAEVTAQRIEHFIATDGKE